MIDGEKYRHLKSEFNAISRKDISGLRAFFDKYSHLSSNQLSRLLDINNLNIRRYKRKAGIKGHDPKHRPRNMAWTISSLPEVSRDISDEDLEKYLTTYSIKQLSKAMGIAYGRLWKRIHDNNIRYKSKKLADASKNPCCNYQWLYETYFIKHRSCLKCSKLAGVYPQTISTWLNKFKIPLLWGPGKVVWLSDTLRELHQEPMVGKVKVDDKKIKISYKGYIETYYYNMKYGSPNYKGRHFNINEKEFIITKKPRINFKYNSNDINQPNDTVYALSRAEFDSYNFIEKRIAIHKLLHILKERGYKLPIIPDEEIQDSIDLVRSVESRLYKFNGSYLTASERYGNHAGKKLIITHYDLGHRYRGIYNSKMHGYVRLMRLIKKPKYDIDEVSLQMINSKPKWFDFIMFAEMMRDIGVNGPILDLSPSERFISISAARLDLPILYPNLDNHLAAIDRGYFTKLGCQYDVWDGHRVDAIVACYFDRYPELDVIKNYLKYGKRLLVYARGRDYKQFKEQLPPKHAIPFRRHPATQRFHHILVY